MMSTCDEVAERIALGEPLAELTDHVTSCDVCRRTTELPAQLGATRHAVDPGLGFSSRMTVGAQQKIAVRRRRRIAASLAATVVAGATGVFLLTHTPAREEEPATNPVAVPTQPIRLENQNPVAAEDAELVTLVRLADVDRSAHVSAHWGHIKKPLAAYKKLLVNADDKGETP